ncbi:MAG TPA: sulfite reductase subunit alpha, partial [Opitutales bacterium]|nr:sulfite reductase subunit alpha [Opitutales bacterium]
GKPTPTLVAAAASVSSSPSDRAALEQIAALPTPAYAEFAAQRRVMDFLVEFPFAKFDAATLVKSLQPLNPRLYSIASAPSASPGVVELAVALVEYPLNGRTVRGVASSFLCEDLRPGTGLLPVFAAKGTLRLPVPESDLVMIGPGTGIAPFRAFLKEREVTQAKGRNWLFYGHRKESEDFYYKDEVLAWQASGLLNKLSLAWSREGAHKRYVQHLMLEHRDELWAWFEAGATIAICGNREHMARDVEAALLQIAAEKGACEASPEGASAWLKSMKASKRIQEDVY